MRKDEESYWQGKMLVMFQGSISKCDIDLLQLICLCSFFNSEPLMHVEGAGSIVRGFLKDKAQKVDSSFVDDLRNFLFAEPGGLFSSTFTKASK